MRLTLTVLGIAALVLVARWSWPDVLEDWRMERDAMRRRGPWGL